MTDWTPPEAMVEEVARALSSFDGRFRIDGRVDNEDGEIEWFIVDRTLPAGEFAFGPIKNQIAVNTELKFRRARAALAASPIGKLVEALEVMWCELNWPEEMNIYGKVNRAMNSRALCRTALGRARGETK